MKQRCTATYTVSFVQDDMDPFSHTLAEALRGISYNVHRGSMSDEPNGKMMMGVWHRPTCDVSWDVKLEDAP